MNPTRYFERWGKKTPWGLEMPILDRACTELQEASVEKVELEMTLFRVGSVYICIFHTHT